MLFAQGAQLIMPSDSISLFDLESDPQYEKLAKRAKVIVDSLTPHNQQPTTHPLLFRLLLAKYLKVKLGMSIQIDIVSIRYMIFNIQTYLIRY